VEAHAEVRQAASLERIDPTSLTEIAPGLLRWTAPHPDWNPDAKPGSSSDWDPMVGSVLYELPDTVVLIDPLLPSVERAQFLHLLDARVVGRPVSILTTIRWHRRDRRELAERYRANSMRVWNYVPAGVQQRPLRGAGETLFWLPAAAALVAGDRLIGDGECGVRVCPQSWLEGVRANRADVAALLRPLLELPIERVLVSHGEPVLQQGHAALEQAIAEAEAG
jgi:hypothetical protein